MQTLKTHFPTVKFRTQWECTFDKKLKSNPELKQRYDAIEIVPAIQPRLHFLRGGVRLI